MRNIRNTRGATSRDVKALLNRSKREHDAAALANMQQAQAHLACAQAIVDRLRTMDRRVHGR